MPPPRHGAKTLMRDAAIAIRHGSPLRRYHAAHEARPGFPALFVAVMRKAPSPAPPRASTSRHLGRQPSPGRAGTRAAGGALQPQQPRHRTNAAAFALRDLARGVLNDLDGIALQMRDFRAGVRGQVRVVANISAITQFLPAELQRFMAAHPQVQVQLQEQISTAVARSVAENAADVGILNHGSYRRPRGCCPTAATSWCWSCRLAMRWRGGAAACGWPMRSIATSSACIRAAPSTRADARRRRAGAPLRLRIRSRATTRSASWSRQASAWASCRAAARSSTAARWPCASSR